MNRRAFLSSASRAVLVVTASRIAAACGDDAGGGGSGAGGAGGAGGNDGDAQPSGGQSPDAAGPVRDPNEVFPQGIASGDPATASVILWTRAVNPDAPGAAVTVGWSVALDEAFTDSVSTGEAEVGSETDHTLRLKVEGLDAGTTYYYRFAAAGATTETGRTRTAPSADDPRPVRFAVASCQDFNGRWYHAWEKLVALDVESPIDFVVFLGDYVYETAADPRFQAAQPDRSITFPDGLNINPEPEGEPILAAVSLADYRALYRQYRGDAMLRRAHARFPFLLVWDDHEFADDAWGEHATHFNELRGDEADVARRLASNQAWFEYQPTDVTRDTAANFPNDLSIFRRVRWGRHVEMFLTDGRTYRADHLVPEGPVDVDVGKVGENTALGSRNFVLKPGFDVKEAASRPTLLGAAQRAWLIEGLTTTTATWKVWGTATQLSQMALDLSGFMELPEMFRKQFYFSVDQWDGYRSERAEILGACAAASVTNLVAVAGDIHAFYASPLLVDYDAPGPAVGVEYVCGAISSQPVKGITEATIAGSPTLTALGLGALVPMFDAILLQGSPHYVYNRSDVNGLAVFEATEAQLRARFLLVGGTASSAAAAAPEVVEFTTPAGRSVIERVG